MSKYAKQPVPFYIGCRYVLSWTEKQNQFILLKINDNYQAILTSVRGKKTKFVKEAVWKLKFVQTKKNIAEAMAMPRDQIKYVVCTPEDLNILPKIPT